jgi:hypothetical protein
MRFLCDKLCFSYPVSFRQTSTFIIYNSVGGKPTHWKPRFYRCSLQQMCKYKIKYTTSKKVVGCERGPSQYLVPKTTLCFVFLLLRNDIFSQRIPSNGRLNGNDTLKTTLNDDFYAVFYYAVSTSGYVASNVKMIHE